MSDVESLHSEISYASEGGRSASTTTSMTGDPPRQAQRVGKQRHRVAGGVTRPSTSMGFAEPSYNHGGGFLATIRDDDSNRD